MSDYLKEDNETTQ